MSEIANVPCLSCQVGYTGRHACDEPDYCPCDRFDSHDEIRLGARLDSTYGEEHRGTVVKLGAFDDGRPMYHVQRDSDGFIWIGWPETVRKVVAENPNIPDPG